jgi:hypothetical protein
MRMTVKLSGKTIVIETNLAFAIPYWTKRKRLNNRITWEVK